MLLFFFFRRNINKRLESKRYCLKMTQYFVLVATLVTLQNSAHARGTPQDIARSYLPKLCPVTNDLSERQTRGQDIEQNSCCTGKLSFYACLL